VVPIEEYLGDLPGRDDLTVSELPFIAGIEPAGRSHIASLDEAPHMLVGGTTGSGKTVFLYSILTCFLERFDPDEFRLAIVDPKLTNFMFCNQLPNLEHDQVITESEDAADLFEWITETEIPRRTQILGNSGSIDIKDHNERSDDPLRPLVVIIDEYADLIDGLGDESDEFETNVRRIAQKARSVGIHLVISTQRPSAKIIDTDLRANLDMRVAFRLPSASDSQVILDDSGAEGLGGNGDLLFKETDSMTRLQGTFVSPDYLRDVVNEVSK
jgi:DNA segregation ATPase FtsK/SpoIIIE-like protein